MRRVSANKNVLSSRLNWGEVMVRQMSCCRSSAGRLFHSRGPATPKLLSRSLDCVRGTIHVWTSADRRCRRPTSVTSWQSSDRYGGARRWSDLSPHVSKHVVPWQKGLCRQSFLWSVNDLELLNISQIVCTDVAHLPLHQPAFLVRILWHFKN